MKMSDFEEASKINQEIDEIENNMKEIHRMLCYCDRGQHMLRNFVMTILEDKLRINLNRSFLPTYPCELNIDRDLLMAIYEHYRKRLEDKKKEFEAVGSE